MPIEVRVDTGARLIRATLSGEVSFEEMALAVNQSVQHPDVAPGFNVFSDHRELAEPATRLQLEQLVDHLTRFKDKMGGARWAVVTHPGSASYGMMRMLGFLAEAVPMVVRPFSDETEALAWLAEADQPPGP
ncbi:MAG: STAS/SEC14 domain-containing protein [Rhodothermales bacterium]|nr:STAS/SEC14 domain-containing protein [Rhodothermales bacterium]